MIGNHRMNSTAYTDPRLSNIKSFGGDNSAQFFVTDFYYVAVYTMDHQRDAPVVLIKYVYKWGVPNNMHIENVI